MTRLQPRTSLPAPADRALGAPAARSRGFTLVEVILALALTTLLLGLLSSGVFIVAVTGIEMPVCWMPASMRRSSFCRSIALYTARFHTATLTRKPYHGSCSLPGI